MNSYSFTMTVPGYWIERIRQLAARCGYQCVLHEDQCMKFLEKDMQLVYSEMLGDRNPTTKFKPDDVLIESMVSFLGNDPDLKIFCET